MALSVNIGQRTECFACSLAVTFRTLAPQIEKSEDEWGVPHCLTLRGQRQSIIVAAR